MATVSTRFVEQEIKELCRLSDGLKKRLFAALEALEQNPRAFRAWEVPDYLGTRQDLYFPKVEIISGKHNYRMLCVCQRHEDGHEHVEALFLFARKTGYPQAIDWSWIDALAQD